MTLPEFIGPLTLCQNTMEDQYAEYQKFTGYITGDDKRREALEAAMNPDGDGGKEGKKKGKKGKKKK